jgi:hypothetical protein
MADAPRVRLSPDGRATVHVPDINGDAKGRWVSVWVRGPWGDLTVEVHDDDTVTGWSEYAAPGAPDPAPTEPADAAHCKSCGRPFSPSHDTTAPGPTARHPFQPAEPADGHSGTAELESIADILFDAGTTDTLLDLVPRLRALADRLAGRPWPADDTQETNHG